MSGSSDTYLDATLVHAHDDSPHSRMAAYNRMVGDRLRTVRVQRLYSLRDVERETGAEFTSSVISAYERGERMMSVQRLDRLARFYNVPIAELLPREGTVDASGSAEAARRLTIRLRRLNELRGEPFDRFRSLVADIQARRCENHDDVVTLREDDLRSVASMFDVPADEMADRLVLLDLLA